MDIRPEIEFMKQRFKVGPFESQQPYDRWHFPQPAPRCASASPTPHDIIRIYIDATRISEQRRHRLTDEESEQLQKLALRKLSSLEVPAADWQEVCQYGYYITEFNGKLKRLVISRIARTAQTYRDWLYILSKPVNGKRYMQQAGEAALKLAASPDELIRAYRKLFACNQASERLTLLFISRMKATSASSDHWGQLYLALPEGHRLRRLALKKMN